MRNISCMNLGKLVINNPYLYSAKWNNGRNLNSLVNLFRNNVYFDDGDPYLTLPLENKFQLKMFSKMLFENKVKHKSNEKDNTITINISWTFKRGSIFENMLKK